MSFLSQLDHNNKRNLSNDLKKQSFSNVRLSPLSINKTTTIASTYNNKNHKQNDMEHSNGNYRNTNSSVTEGHKKKNVSTPPHMSEQQRRHYFLKEVNKMIISNRYTQSDIDTKYGVRSADISIRTNNNNTNNINNKNINAMYLLPSTIQEELESKIESSSKSDHNSLIIPKRRRKTINNDKQNQSNDIKLDLYPSLIEKEYTSNYNQPNNINSISSETKHSLFKRKTFEYYEQKNKKPLRYSANNERDVNSSITTTSTTFYQPMLSRNNSETFKNNINVNASLPANERRQYYLKKCNELIPSIPPSKKDNNKNNIFNFNDNYESTNKPNIIPPPPLSSSSPLYSPSSPFSQFLIQNENEMINAEQLIKVTNNNDNNSKPFVIKKNESFSDTTHNNNNTEAYPIFTSLSSVVFGSTFTDLIKSPPKSMSKKLILKKISNSNNNVLSILDSEFDSNTNMDKPLYDDGSFEKDTNSSIINNDYNGDYNNNGNKDNSSVIENDDGPNEHVNDDCDNNNDNELLDTDGPLTIEELFPNKVVPKKKIQSKYNSTLDTRFLNYIEFKEPSKKIEDEMDFFNNEVSKKYDTDYINGFEGFSDGE